ncbi:MAG: TetR/AcrR family transcriptional regulator [Proteobacteria bacterium]|nr:TetR/AcrR family transcriptional regulator [Pseudomonadota bacterium]
MVGKKDKKPKKDKTGPLTDKQRRVLDAAMEVFAEQGFSATSTSEIAKRAGVAAGTVFRFYKTKKDLLVGAVAPLFKRFVAPSLVREFGKVLQADHATLESFIGAVLQDWLEFVQKNRRVIRVALQETPLHPELRALWQESIMDQLRPMVLDQIEGLQDRGLVVVLPPETVARMMASVFAGYAMQRFFVEPDREWDDGAELAAMVDVLGRGLAPREAA